MLVTEKLVLYKKHVKAVLLMIDSGPFKRKDLNTKKGCIPAHSLLFMKIDVFTSDVFFILLSFCSPKQTVNPTCHFNFDEVRRYVERDKIPKSCCDSVRVIAHFHFIPNLIHTKLFGQISLS